MLSIKNQNGGSIDIEVSRSMTHGYRVWVHIDESVNINNGEGEASTLLTISECKELLSMLNEVIKLSDGVDYVYTRDSVVNLITTPEIQDILSKLGYDKPTPEQVENPE